MADDRITAFIHNRGRAVITHSSVSQDSSRIFTATRAISNSTYVPPELPPPLPPRMTCVQREPPPYPPRYSVPPAVSAVVSQPLPEAMIAAGPTDMIKHTEAGRDNEQLTLLKLPEKVLPASSVKQRIIKSFHQLKSKITQRNIKIDGELAGVDLSIKDVARMGTVLLKNVPAFISQEEINRRVMMLKIISDRYNSDVINMAHVDLSHMYMAGKDLSGLDLTYMSFMRVDLRGACLKNINAFRTSFYAADLRNVKLTGTLIATRLDAAKVDGATIRCDLTQIDLQGVFGLENAFLRGSTLAFTRCSLERLAATNTFVLHREGDPAPVQFTGLQIPANWDVNNLDIFFNHFNNMTSSSLVGEIDKFDEKYNGDKIRLVQSLIKSLKDVDIATVALPILTVLYKAPYLNDPQLSSSIKTLCADVMNSYRNALLPELLDIIPVVLQFFTENPHCMVTHNALFIQTVLRCLNNASLMSLGERTIRAQALYPATLQSRKKALNDAIQQYRQQAIQLYDCYLASDPVIKYRPLSETGSFEYPPDWSDPDAFNFILLASGPAITEESAQNPAKTPPAIICSKTTLDAMMCAEDSEQWEKILTYASPDHYIPPQQWREHNYLRDGFGLLHRLSLGRSVLNDLHGLLATIFSPPSAEGAGASEGLLAQFRQATSTFNHNEPLTDLENQELLSQYFSSLHSGERIEDIALTEMHYQQILQAYHLTDASNLQKAQLMLSQAAIFINYSSSRHFGEEEISLEALRRHSWTLMKKARELDPRVFMRSNVDQFADWKSRLLGENNAFSCSSLLYDMITQHMSDYWRACLQYLPPCWGGDARAGNRGAAALNERPAIRLLPVSSPELYVPVNLNSLCHIIHSPDAWHHPSFEVLPELIALSKSFVKQRAFLVITNQSGTVLRVINSANGNVVNPAVALSSGRRLAVIQNEAEVHYNAWVAEEGNVRFVRDGADFRVDTSASKNQLCAVPGSGFCMTEAAMLALGRRGHVFTRESLAAHGRKLREEIIDVIYEASPERYTRLENEIAAAAGNPAHAALTT